MVNSINKIATSQEHRKSPFTYKVPCAERRSSPNEKYSYQLSTLQKIVSVALAILTAPLLIGSLLTFYLVTAYFKNKALKQIGPEDGLTVQRQCPMTQKEVLMHRGFGTFRPSEEEDEINCPACQEPDPINTIFLKHCKYSYKGRVNKTEQKIREENLVVQQEKKTTFCVDEPDREWRYFILKVEPLIS